MGKPSDVLVVVDVQNDFCPGGALPVPRGDEVVGPINAAMRSFERVVLSQDWHPAGHVSFASSHPVGADGGSADSGGIGRILWPDHCVQGTRGAAFHPKLDSDRASIILRKGSSPGIDSYSCFFENDRITPTGLEGWLRSLGASKVFVAGLALDYCVLYTALDALRLGFETVVLEDCVRAVGLPPGSGERSIESLRGAGASFARSEEVS
jgi:nicotinamidase/pyrazinamidase